MIMGKCMSGSFCPINIWGDDCVIGILDNKSALIKLNWKYYVLLNLLFAKEFEFFKLVINECVK